MSGTEPPLKSVLSPSKFSSQQGDVIAILHSGILKKKLGLLISVHKTITSAQPKSHSVVYPDS